MAGDRINANQMALERGVDPKRYRARLRRNLWADHTPGSWETVIGSDKHRRMSSELEALIAELRNA